MPIDQYDWGTHWGQWLATELRQRGITRAELIRRSPMKDNGRPEIDNSILGRWLNGMRPTFEKAVAVADALNMDAEEVVRNAGFMATPGEPMRLSDSRSDHLIIRMETDAEVHAVHQFLQILRRQRIADGTLTAGGPENGYH